MTDKEFMEEAYKEAVSAGERGECPVGAVIVKGGKIIARAGNEEQGTCDPTAHAEILCLRRAGKALGSRFLQGCTVFTTLWPCPMCLGAMLQAQVEKVVSGSRSFKWVKEVRFDNGNLQCVGPVMEDECRRLFIAWARKNGRDDILEYESAVR